MTFKSLELIDEIQLAVEKDGYETPSPIQAQAIPVLLSGKDILASAQTGTGKTAAFSIPILQKLYYKRIEGVNDKVIKALVLAPTRELAEQIKDSFRSYGKYLKIKTDVIYGGVSQKNQEKSLRSGLDVLIATPGRLLDLMGQGLVKLNHVEYFVLDEADRMLDMGFIHDVRKIESYLSKQRQTALFSATIPKDILKLAEELLKDPVRIEVTPPEAMVDKIKQSLFLVPKKDKFNLLLDLLTNKALESVLVFSRTKHGANKVVTSLLSYGVKASAIHGNKSQNQRQQALTDFKNKKVRVLVATDIAARGIDIDELSHVINYDLPETPETYVHRMGRTGRAGMAGEAYSFCSQDEHNLLRDIEKHIKMPIPVNQNHKFHVSIKLEHIESTETVKKPIRSRDNKSSSNTSSKFKDNRKSTLKTEKKPTRSSNGFNKASDTFSKSVTKKKPTQKQTDFSDEFDYKKDKKYLKRTEDISTHYFNKRQSR